MRPKGEVHLALVASVKALATPERGVTQRELAAHSRVASGVVRYMVSAMVKHGALVIARTRRVPYRNRPVAEYALPDAASGRPESSINVLTSALSAWHTSHRA